MSKKEIIHRKQLLRAAVLLALGTATTSAVYAAVTANNANFTMLAGAGGTVGGANDVAFIWDGTLNDDPATAVSNASIESITPTAFFGLNWTAYNVKIYGPGSYTISTTDVAGSADCPYGLTTCASGLTDYSVNVSAGQIMAHMKFAYGNTEGIDVINVWVPGDWTALNPNTIRDNTIFTGPEGTYSGPVYGLVSTDWNGDNIAGGGMVDGPFPGFNANFNVNAGGAVTLTCPPNCPPPETQITTPEPSTASGCSMTGSSPSSVTQGADWWIVAGFLTWLGVLRMRVKRKTKS
jgi:hypothetical protein